MHELAIAEGILHGVCERAAGRTVHKVTVRIGAMAAVLPDALRFCFDLAAEGTAAEGATLEIEESPGGDLLVVSMEVAQPCA